VPHPPSSRLPLVVAVGAAPALASEGPVGPAPLPTGTAPVVIPPLPTHTAPGQLGSRPRLSHVRVVPRRLRHGRRAKLRLTLSGPGQLSVTIRRMSRPGRGRFATGRRTVVGGKVSLRLPRRAHGKRLAAGRYRISIRVTDAQGLRSRTVRRTLVVLR
jgi:hypothetical protein